MRSLISSLSLECNVYLGVSNVPEIFVFALMAFYVCAIGVRLRAQHFSRLEALAERSG
ncbi:hypothetical protein BN2476_250132 [Paraburkholderia piptadeniae]|uniref:Uncharacterized protein n=1 Tax=Paraburkholderia piptadeniae TaxID=1701573 RepID=A0A1N7S0Q0_9BURK|nr:hypothetical protein BN2476_250132 [Paraburkholderia piptadeniae]